MSSGRPTFAHLHDRSGDQPSPAQSEENIVGRGLPMHSKEALLGRGLPTTSHLDEQLWAALAGSLQGGYCEQRPAYVFTHRWQQQ